MGKDSPRHYQHHLQQLPSNWTASPSTSSSHHNFTLPPISALTTTATRSRTPSASKSTPSSSPSSSHSSSSRSNDPIEPQSPYDAHPLIAPTHRLTMTTHSPAHRSYPSNLNNGHHSSAEDHHHHQHSHQHATPSHYSRPVEDGSHLWGDGMKGIWGSLTGAPPSKSRSPLPLGSNSSNGVKGEHLEPARPSEVAAATSIWDIPRETVAMTMGFEGNYQSQNYPSQQVWQQQQQQQQMSGYPSNADGQQSSYSNAPAPSGLAGGPADSSRPRGVSDVGPQTDRHYARRQTYGRPEDGATDSSNNAQWWSAESNAAVDDPSAAGHYGARRLQPPPLPETRSANRPTWSNQGGFEISGYEFPQSSLGKRQYDEEASGIADSSDSAARRYSLAPNMSFSRPSAPISSMMNSYRPSQHDPRRPSLPSDPYGNQQQASTAQRTGYPNAPQWSPWAGAGSHSGMPGGGMSNSGSSPNLSGWRDGGVARHGIESGYLSPSGMPGTDKRQNRDRSSSSASAIQQANTLANTPFHITTDIILRAPAGSKMEDVYYDQHCELRTGMADPPASDFEVENEEDRPRLQTDKLRFPGDLYTPRWVRGAGNSREAWCDRCESGNWLQLKNSQYWYDQVHKHGISSVSGLRFTAPTHLKVYADAAGTVEGKCHQCKEWVLICTAKRRRNFAAFFKHAHACHSYRKASAVGNGPYVEHNPGGHRNKKSPPM